MTFFVSDALKGRVTEENLLNDEPTQEDPVKPLISVRASFLDYVHYFDFLSLEKKDKQKIVTLLIPESYEYTSNLINSRVVFEIISLGDVICTLDYQENDFEISRHYERNCYLLKIVIDE